MKNYINSLVEDLDDFLKSAAVNFLNEVDEYNVHSGNYSYFAYERMLSDLSNNYLASLFVENPKINLKLAVSEFPINITDSKGKFNIVSSEVGGNKRRTSWNKCFIDGYFKIENNDENYHLFLEYKMQDVFSYVDLATDYLKYKLYTYKCNLKTIFGYIIFKKENNYPSIIENLNKKFCYLKKNISSKDIYDTRVYIYDENNAVSDDNIVKLPELVKSMDKFSRYGSDLIDINNKDIDELKQDETLLLDLLPKFNSRVIKSNLIRDNYDFIIKLWNKTQELGTFKKFEDQIETGGIEKKKEILEKGSLYNYYLDAEQSDIDRKMAEENGIRGSSYTSLNLLALLDFFSEEYKINISKPNYGFKKIGRSKNKTVLNYQVTAENRKNKLRKHYYKNKDNLEIICFSLMYFIINVYDVLFEIDKSTYKVGEEKLISKKIKLEENIQKIYDEISKILGYKTKLKIKDLKDDIQLKNLFLYILNMYE